MFDFFKEVIINSDTLPTEEGIDVSGNPFKRFYALTPDTAAEDIGSDPAHYRAPKEGVFRVLRCADYTKSAVKDGKIHKTFGTKGKVAQVEFNLNSINSVPGQYRIIIDISLENRYYSDYKYPWSAFHKPVMVEFDVPESSKLETLTDTVVATLKKYVPSDYKYAISRKKAAGEVQVMCADPYQVIKSAKIQKVVESGCYEGCSDCEYVDTDVAVNITKNVAPFATGEWLTENLRFPTYPNLRYASVNDDEKPIRGATYVQYTFDYVSPRKGLSGQGTVGQALTSVTHHVFYVLDSLASKFDEAISKIGEIVPMNGTIVILNGGKEENEITVTVDQITGNQVSLKATFSEQKEGNAEFEWSINMTQGSGYSVDPSKGAETTVKCTSPSKGDAGTVTATIGNVFVSKPIKVTA